MIATRSPSCNCRQLAILRKKIAAFANRPDHIHRFARGAARLPTGTIS